MPNWCEARIDVTLPTKNINKFLRHFIGSEPYENRENPDALDFFYRTFYQDHHIIKEEKDITTMVIYCDCAWSCEGCLDFGKNPFDDETVECCMTLDEACKEAEVICLHGESEEPGLCFGENFDWEQGEDGVGWEVFDITNYECKECDMFFSAREDDGAECPSCGKWIEPYKEDEEDDDEEQE